MGAQYFLLRVGGKSGRSLDKRLAVVVFFFFFLLVSVNSRAWGETQVVFTVDVESSRAISLPEQVDAVCKDGSACGLTEISDMLRERGLSGTFFLNVFEYPRWGKAVMRDIAVKLQAAGQDVELHTHPETVYDPLRSEMYQYSLNEQVAIIRDGLKLLKSWTGRSAVAHRAGDYSANERTLDALVQNGIRIDSSLFWGHPQCRLTELGMPLNIPSSRGGLVEVPVTVYHREELPRIFGSFFSPVTSVRKIDADWLIDGDEAKAAIDASVKADIPIIVIFLHSFSFLEEKRDGGAHAGRHARDVLQAILDRVNEKRLHVVTMRDLAKTGTLAATFQTQDVIPPVPVRVALSHYVWHRLHHGGLGGLTEALLLLSLVAGCILVVMWRRSHVVDSGDGRRPEGRSAPGSGGSEP